VVDRAYFARRFLALKLLRGALVAGALYDAALAALLLWRPGSAAGLLGLATPAAPALARLAALWLAMLAALGLAAGRDIRRYSAVIAALICGRAVAAVMLTTTALAAAAALPWSAPWNALLATALIATWWPQRA
jgi:hypothetical protein